MHEIATKRAFSSFVGAILPAILALLVAWIALDLLVWGYGASPRTVLRDLLLGTWGNPYGIGQVLFKASPLLLTGLSVHVALRAGLFNIGAEGQLTVASLAVAAAGVHLPRSPFSLPALFVVGAVAGAAWALLPAILRVYFRGHEVLSTLLLNRLADPLVSLLLGVGLAVPGTVRTPDVQSVLPRLEAFLPSLRGSAASLAFPLGVGLVAVTLWMFHRTVLGREIDLIGGNARACALAGIPVERRLLATMLFSGAIAGLASASTVLGYKGYYEQGLGAGTGFTGVGVALMGGGSAVGILLASLLFGTLAQGGLAINAHIPREALQLMEALVIVLVALSNARARDVLLSWTRTTGRS